MQLQERLAVAQVIFNRFHQQLSKKLHLHAEATCHFCPSQSSVAC